MLEFLIGETQIDLKPKTAINLKLKNPMFHEQGSHSLNFSLLKTDHNLKLFGLPNRIQKYGIGSKVFSDFSIRFKPLSYFGTIKVNEVSEGGIECYILLDKGEFNSTVTGKTLKDLTLGGDRTIGFDFPSNVSHFKDTTTGTADDYDYVFYPVSNESYYDGSLWETIYTNYLHVNYYHPTSFFNAYNQETYVPFPYLVYIMKRIYEENGFSVNRNTMNDDDELKSLTLFNLMSQNKFAFLGLGWNNRSYTNINLNNHVPNMDIKTFIKGIEKMFGAVTFINNKTKSVDIFLLKDIVTDSNFVDITSISDTNNGITDEIIDGFRLKLNPDSADSYFNDNVVDVWEYTVLDPVQTFGDLPTTDDDQTIRLVIDEDQYYIFKLTSFAAPKTWNFISRNYVDYVSEGQDLEIKSEISTLLMFRGTDNHNLPSAARDWLIPKAEQLGNHLDLFDFVNEFKPRLLFYRGIKEDSNGDDYPLASSETVDYSGTTIGNYSLKWEGDSGLYKNFWEKYLYWYINIRRKVDKFIDWPISMLSEIEFYRKFRIDETNYLISEIELTLTNNKIVNKNTTLFKIN